MGLAAPKNRMKLSHDPNNTKWTNDTQSFGHKIMTSQGWQPGEYLGAKNAAHAEFHTEANASHIRVSIKDDNLGLGAKIGSGVGHGECTGLDAFQNLLGRLNGRDEDELEREQKSREDLKRAIYAEQRWGSIRFVKGGLLIGDKIQPLIEAEAERVRKLTVGATSASDSSDSSSSLESDEEALARVQKTKKSKKRKLEEVEEAVPEAVAVKTKKSKKKRKSEASPADEEDVAAALKEVTLSKKKTKKGQESKPDSEDTQDEERSKQRKKEKKEKKREKKEVREKAKVREEETAKESKKKSKRDKRKAGQEEATESSESSRVATKESTPLAAESSGRSTPMMQGRHAVRSRNIAQKRLASMDVASLNQIFMIKSQT